MLQEVLHLREGERVDLRLLLLEATDHLAGVLPDVPPALCIIEQAFDRDHDVVLSLRREFHQLLHELLHVPVGHIAQRSFPEVRDGVDLHGRAVVPVCGLRDRHFLPVGQTPIRN